MRRLRRSALCTFATALMTVVACGGRTIGWCTADDVTAVDASDGVIVPPVAFTPRSATSTRAFSQILVVISDAPNACQQFQSVKATNAPIEAHWLVIAVPDRIGQGVIGEAGVTAEVVHYCPGDVPELDGGTAVVATSGRVDVTAYSEGARIAGTYELQFAGGSSARGSFDVGYCP
jgi:hypothetical protein